ncbi:flavohemoprotein [Bacillus sp. JCM 19046]|nr:flavohemoprotein [Bacillus sp. JCM 19045]GAF20365.1 flavohemoprotein [Bacillus sp. JCM 19046]
MLGQETIKTIKATAPVLAEHGLAITTHFYTLLLEQHPELWHVFNHANQKRGIQQQALADSLYAAAVHIEQLEAIVPVVKKIAHKHRSIGVQAEHYPIVGDYLLKAMKDVLKEDATDSILTAWEEAYSVIAKLFIETEANLYAEAGWQDDQPLVVTKKIQESSDITSIYLQRADGKELPPFTPGQYISVKRNVQGYDQIRQYSLTSVPTENEYRISVKAEQGGLLSNLLYSELRVGETILTSAPAGNFTYSKTSNSPLLFISGGSGITPFVSMIKTLELERPERAVYLVHATRNSETHAFKQEIDAIVKNNEKIESTTIYRSPLATDRFDYQGEIHVDMLQPVLLKAKEVSIYVSGSRAFVQEVYALLTTYGVNSDQIQFESFEPALALS